MNIQIRDNFFFFKLTPVFL